jgi:hypothetical protein
MVTNPQNGKPVIVVIPLEAELTKPALHQGAPHIEPRYRD